MGLKIVNKQKDTVVNVPVTIGYRISNKGIAIPIDSFMKIKTPIININNFHYSNGYDLHNKDIKKYMDSVWNARNSK